MMVPAEEVVSDIAHHFCLLKKRRCNENPAVWGGYGHHGQTCGVQTWWVVLLKISWAWKFHLKMP
jgi:hypothetical protein